MRKFLGKLLSSLVVMTLVFGLAFNVQASAIPTSFDLTVSTELSVDVNIDETWLSNTELLVLEVLAGGVGLDLNATLVTDDLAASMFYELTLEIPGLDGTSFTIRYWVEADFNDMENPTLIYVLELPLMLRLLLSVELAWINVNHQFIVVDLSDYILDFISLAEYYVNELFSSITEEDIEALAEIFLYEFNRQFEVETGMSFEEAMNEFPQIWEEVVNELTLLWEEVKQFVTFDFNFSRPEIENGFAVDFDFSFAAEYEEESISMDFAFYGEISNLNTAERVSLPTLTEANSLDLLALLMQLF